MSEKEYNNCLASVDSGAARSHSDAKPLIGLANTQTVICCLRLEDVQEPGAEEYGKRKYRKSARADDSHGLAASSAAAAQEGVVTRVTCTPYFHHAHATAPSALSGSMSSTVIAAATEARATTPMSRATERVHILRRGGGERLMQQLPPTMNRATERDA